MPIPTHLPRLAQPTGWIVRLIETWLEVARERRMLATLDDRMLKDIGISRASANHEAQRPFWDIPGDRLPEQPMVENTDCCTPGCCAPSVPASA